MGCFDAGMRPIEATAPSRLPASGLAVRMLVAPPMETAYAITARPRKGRVSLIRGINSDAQDGQDGEFVVPAKAGTSPPFPVMLSEAEASLRGVGIDERLPERFLGFARNDN